MTALGYALIVAGVCILGGSLFLAYVTYTSLSVQGLPPLQNATSGAMADSMAVLVNNLSSTVYSESITALKMLVLFLMASIGFKIASLGVSEVKEQVCNCGNQGEEKETKEKY